MVMCMVLGMFCLFPNHTTAVLVRSKTDQPGTHFVLAALCAVPSRSEGTDPPQSPLAALCAPPDPPHSPLASTLCSARSAPSAPRKHSVLRTAVANYNSQALCSRRPIQPVLCCVVWCCVVWCGVCCVMCCNVACAVCLYRLFDNVCCVCCVVVCVVLFVCVVVCVVLFVCCCDVLCCSLFGNVCCVVVLLFRCLTNTSHT
jgi:hypothetical protein